MVVKPDKTAMFSAITASWGHQSSRYNLWQTVYASVLSSFSILLNAAWKVFDVKRKQNPNGGTVVKIALWRQTLKLLSNNLSNEEDSHTNTTRTFMPKGYGTLAAIHRTVQWYMTINLWYSIYKLVQSEKYPPVQEGSIDVPSCCEGNST